MNIELSSWHFVSCVSINRTGLRFPRRYLQHLTCNESPFTVLFVLNISTTLRLSFIFLPIEFDFWFRVWHSPIILWKCTPQSIIVGYIFYYNSRWTWWLSSPHQRTLKIFEWQFNPASSSSVKSLCWTRLISFEKIVDAYILRVRKFKKSNTNESIFPVFKADSLL